MYRQRIGERKLRRGRIVMTDAVFALSTVDLPCLQRTPDCQRGNTVRLLSANIVFSQIFSDNFIKQLIVLHSKHFHFIK